MPRAKNDEAARRLATIPGLGVRNATALAAAIGGGQTFARGRDLAAWLGPNEVEPEQTWQTFQKLFAMVNHIDAESGIRRRRQPYPRFGISSRISDALAGFVNGAANLFSRGLQSSRHRLRPTRSQPEPRQRYQAPEILHRRAPATRKAPQAR
jgi:Transposase IS116/IS110/IS902 family